MVMLEIADLSKEAPMSNVLVKVVDGIDDKKHHGFIEITLVAHPLLGLEALHQGSNQSSQHSTMMRASKESNQLVWEERGLRVKVNLQFFKDEKNKDAVTYHSWRWDVAI